MAIESECSTQYAEQTNPDGVRLNFGYFHFRSTMQKLLSAPLADRYELDENAALMISQREFESINPDITLVFPNAETAGAFGGKNPDAQCAIEITQS